jgi:plastocyanin
LCTNAPLWGREQQQQEKEEEVALMRRVILLMTVAAVVLVSALVVVVSAGAHQHQPGGTHQHPTKKVLIKNFRFSPAKITIKRGTRVVWINKDNAPHTATANNARSFDSGRLGPRQRFSHTFRSAGKKSYHCEIHSSMKGRITVKR